MKTQSLRIIKAACLMAVFCLPLALHAQEAENTFTVNAKNALGLAHVDHQS